MTMDEMVIAIRVTADGVAEIIGEVKDEMKGVGEEADKIQNDTGDAFEPMTRGAEEAAVAQAALATAAAATFAKITEVVQTSTDAYNAYVAATQGLQSVAAGRGIGEEEMARALEQVTDGFFSARAAAQAYKNLLSRGFTLDQATQTLERLKDAAAFGRAANLSLEDAVVSATEGIKNENSVLVDNAGVTKNVAKMWEDYAKARNLTTANLTQAQKVEAEYLGIITETQLQMGDLAKASETLAGAQAENAATATELAVTYGDAMAPAMQMVTEVSTGVYEALAAILSAAPGAAAGITAAVAGMALMITIGSAASGVAALFAGGLLKISPVMVALSGALGIGTAAYTSFKKKQDDVAEAQRKAAEAAAAEKKANEERVGTITSQITELTKLGDEYKTLAEKESLSADEQERLDRIIGILTTQYGLSEAALRDLAEGYDSGSDAIADRITLLNDERIALLEKQKAEKQALADQLAAENHNRASVMAQLVIGGRPDFENGMNWIRDEFGNLIDDTGWKTALDNWMAGFYGKAPEVVKAAQELHDALYNAENYEQAEAIYNAYFNGIKRQSEEAVEELKALNDEIAAIDEAIATPPEQLSERTYEGAQEGGTNFMAASEQAKENAKAALEYERERQQLLQENIAAQQQLNTLMSESATEAEKLAAAQALEDAGWGSLYGDAQGQADLLSYLTGQMDTLTEGYAEGAGKFEEMAANLKAAFDAGEISAEEYYGMLSQMYDLIANLPEGVEFDPSSLKTFKKEAKSTEEIIEDLGIQGHETGKKLENALNFRAEVRSLRDLARQVKDSGGGWEDLSDEVKDFAGKLGVAEGDIDGTIFALENMEAQTDSSIQTMTSEIQGIIGTLEAMRAEIIAASGGTLDIDTSPAIAAINALLNYLYAYMSEAAAAGVEPAPVARRGGGGGRKKDTSAEDAAREAERRQEEAYRKAIEAIEHKRHLNEITAQEEIEELERVKREYAKTADQIMDIDERIYDARQDLRRDEEGKISTLYDSIVDALEARYEEQREIEQRRINDSISAWEKWSDDTCAAIQKQIDALDDQIEAEDRAATEAEHLRKIASIEQAIDYEKDAYNQQQLVKQLEEAQKAWAEIQKGWERDDQRKALEDQMQAVQDRADAEIEALEKESERIDSVYDEMLKGQSLAAEAQKLLMESTQEDLLALLTSYAPDYEATGRTLGEKIFEGFKSAFGDVSAFFESIDAQFEQMADRAQSAAFGKTQNLQASGQAAATVAAPTINQTVNFNQPVESPADVTRRMQQVSEELAGMM